MANFESKLLAKSDIAKVPASSILTWFVKCRPLSNLELHSTWCALQFSAARGPLVETLHLPPDLSASRLPILRVCECFEPLRLTRVS